MNIHQKYMLQAIQMAERAFRENEIPVGAVVVFQGLVIGKGYNQVETLKDATAHAEMIAISAAMAYLESKYLPDCTLYVTLEPCPMCTGALVWSKIPRVVFGAMDTKAGACGSVFNIGSNSQLNHQLEIIQGVLEADCEWLLKEFFKKIR